MNYEDLRNQALHRWNSGRERGRAWVRVGSGTCGRAAGATEVLEAFRDAVSRTEPPLSPRILEVGCLGLCYAEPLVDIRGSDGRRILYHRVDPGTVPELVKRHLVDGLPVPKLALATLEGEPVDDLPSFHDLPPLRPQMRLAMRNCGHVDPTDLYHYVAEGGYRALEQVLRSDPEAVIDGIEASLLRGRGGGGFPTGKKWRLCRQAPGDRRYVICNGDEGDPGAFMDRSLMEGDPHAVIEGMLIGARAIGAREGALYVRGEYPLAIERFRLALRQAYEAGVLGRGILGSDFDFDLRLVCNAGAFVSGEETALIRSVEGRSAEPRPRPPFPAQSGLDGSPTCINNVETWANVPLIIEKGPEWFRGVGTEGNGGTKLFSLSGKVNHTGLVEVPMGTPLRVVVSEIGGGVPGGRGIKAVQTGGPAGGCIPEPMLDLPLTYEGLSEAGAIMGSGGMIVLDQRTCMVEVARYFLEFTTQESCGKCTPCREGTRCMLEILENIVTGNAVPEDLDLLERLARGVAAASLCGLGQNAPNPVLSTLRYFKDEYRAHVVEKRCPAKSCAALLAFEIDPERCTGCGLCYRDCPAGAIVWKKKEAARIDKDACIRCMTCFEHCRYDAIF